MSLLNNIFGAGAQQALMGSEQEMYDMRAQQYSAALAHSMMNTKQAVAQGIMASQQIPFNPNEVEAYKIPLSNLVTLWQAKFGDTWVQKFDEAFWADAMFRLKVAGKLEEAKHTWYRIKEDA
jgi:hypothetical protein